MNPYDFVRFPKRPARRISVRDRGHDHLTGENGHITCQLKALTHIFTPRARETPTDRKTHENLSFFQAGSAYALPGTSLKGVLRQVAEALSSSCFLFDRLYYRDRLGPRRININYKLPRGYRYCNNVDKLCPACRMFGFLNRGEVFGGQVSVSDAVAESDFRTESLTLAPLMTPKPRHRAFYGTGPNNEFAKGWKFYYHHPPNRVQTAEPSRYNKTVEAALPGASFLFKVSYTNLNPDELGLLLYALMLESGMRHKIGMGKPIGMGSVHLRVIGWHRLDPQQRYATIGGGITSLEGDAAFNAAWDYVTKHPDLLVSRAVKDLRRIWRWPVDPKVRVHYPDWGWFKDHRSTPLSKVP
jgi:CRISPR/Cas system CSM-associated protein Csm3 (group 7 of RAMP superfamily)